MKGPPRSASSAKRPPTSPRNAIINPLMGLTLARSRRPAAARPALRLRAAPRREHARPAAWRSAAARPSAPSCWIRATRRFHTYQEFSMPMMLGGFLSLTPQAGIGYSRYGSVEGPEDDSGPDPAPRRRGNLAEILQGPRRLSELPLGPRRPDARPPALWQLVVHFHQRLRARRSRVDRLTPTTRPRPLGPAALHRHRRIAELERAALRRAQPPAHQTRRPELRVALSGHLHGCLHRRPGRPAEFFQPLQRRPLAAAAMDGRRSGNPVPDRQRRLGFQRVQHPAAFPAHRPLRVFPRLPLAGRPPGAAWIPTASTSSPTPA